MHIAAGLDNPLVPGLKLKQTLRGIERKHFSTPKRKLPITFDILCRIRPFVDMSREEDCVYWSAVTTAHFLLLRAGEFTIPKSELFDPSRHLTLGDIDLRVAPDSREYLTINLKHSKTDQEGQGVLLYLSHSKHKVCGLCAMKANLTLQRHRKNSSFDSPLFALSDQQPLSRDRLMGFLSQLLRLIGLDPCKYSGHSFRIGGATSASLAGLKDYEIQLLGRWKSSCYKTYIRTPLNLLLNIPERLAATSSITYQYANPYSVEPSDQHPT